MASDPPVPLFEPLAVDDPRIDALLDVVRATYVNGGALLGAFTVRFDGPHSWYWKSQPEGPGVYDFSAFFASQALAEALPELETGDGFRIEANWERTGPFMLDGELTAVLVQGGAYDRFQGPPQEAKRLAMAFCEAVFDYRYTQVDVYRSSEYWSPWFEAVAWDYSWLILDDERSRVWLLCVTDTD
jgi:hypothetical protein